MNFFLFWLLVTLMCTIFLWLSDWSALTLLIPPFSTFYLSHPVPPCLPRPQLHSVPPSMSSGYINMSIPARAAFDEERWVLSAHQLVSKYY
jgi:hypothetical protein